MSHGIGGLVDRQIRRWEVTRRSRATEPARPCIALSRFPGTRADLVSARLAERLGFALFDKAIVEQIARATGLQEQLVEGVDGQMRSAIERFVADGFRRQQFTESDYAQQVVRLLATVGERGGAVILGRGAPLVLPPERALRVLLVAPREIRVARAAEALGVDAKAAAAAVEREDRARHEFLKAHFRVDADDPLNYDLTLNTAHLDVEAAAAAIEAVYRLRFPEAARAAV
jgi:cytidylate kinase